VADPAVGLAATLALLLEVVAVAASAVVAVGLASGTLAVGTVVLAAAAPLTGIWLLFDVGWLNLLPQFLNQLKTYRIGLPEIKYIIFSHHHPGHADLVQTVKRLSGARLLIHARQVSYWAASYLGNPNFEPIVVGPTDRISPDRAALHALGINGEMVETPGHSDDSISLVLDSGMAFTGDLVPPHLVGEESQAVTCQSWQKLARLKASTIYPAHANPFQLSEIEPYLLDEC
jgi:ribonuclease/clavin/mitogillin